MTLRLLLVFIAFVSFSSVWSQEQNIAAIVDEKTHEIDIVFVTKILVMLFLGIIAILGYMKYRKTEP